MKKKDNFWNNAFTYLENTTKIWLAVAHELCSNIEAKTIRKVQHQEWETKSNASNYSGSYSLIHWGFTFLIIYFCNSFFRTKRRYSPDTTNCICGHLTCVFVHHLENQQFIISNLTSFQIVKNNYLQYSWLKTKWLNFINWIESSLSYLNGSLWWFIFLSHLSNSPC